MNIMLFEIISYTIVGIFVSPLFFPVRWYRRDQRRTYGRNAEIYGGHHNIHHSEDDSEHDSEYDSEQDSEHDRTLLISK
jgi:hypothetical protein